MLGAAQGGLGGCHVAVSIICERRRPAATARWTGRRRAGPLIWRRVRGLQAQEAAAGGRGLAADVDILPSTVRSLSGVFTHPVSCHMIDSESTATHRRRGSPGASCLMNLGEGAQNKQRFSKSCKQLKQLGPRRLLKV